MTILRATGLETVVSVRVIPPFTLEVAFDDGVVRRLDMQPELSNPGPVFQPLTDPAYFALVQVDPEAGTVVWPNGADLAPEFLYDGGVPVEP